MDHVQRLDNISLDHMYSVRYGEDGHYCVKTPALPSSTPQGIYLKRCTRSKYQAVMRSLPYGGRPQSHLVYTLDLMSSPMTGGDPHLPACRRWIADGVEDGQVIPDERRTGWKQMVHQFQLPACWGTRGVNSLQPFCNNFVRETKGRVPRIEFSSLLEFIWSIGIVIDFITVLFQSAILCC